MDWTESVEAIAKVDELLASVGLEHGTRETRRVAREGGERKRAQPGVPAAVGQGASRKKVGPRANQVGPAGLPVVQAEGWDQYHWLRHGFSTRLGGVSNVYGAGTLNLGWTKDDEAGKVAENRRRLLREITGDEVARLVTLRQFHSGLVRVIEVEDGALQGGLETEQGRAVLRGDGMMTNVPDVMLGVQVADCVPVLVTDVRRRAVAAFHAGWRGTLARIVERGIGRMRLRYGSRPEDLVAAVGPSIGPCCYSVGEEVRQEFRSQFVYSEQLFSEVYDSDPVRDRYPLLFMTARAPGHSNIGPQLHLNLWEANRRQLLEAGVKAGRIEVLGECSACARGEGGGLKYFSHRGESGFAGRMMGVVGVAS